MNKNVLLFGTLAVLLTGVYFFQEKRTEQKYNEALVKDRVFTGEITALAFNEVKAEKKNGQWWMGETLLSANTFRTIEREIHEIKKVKDIQGDWQSFFPQPITLSINGTQWTLGGMNLDKTGFYLGHQNKIILAVIEGESVQLTSSEEDIERMKLEELLQLLTKSPEELKETQLFRFYPELPLQRVMVEAEGKVTFELDFEKNQTLPPPIPGINIHEKLRDKFSSLLTQATLKEEIPFPKKLFKQMGKITFINEQKKVAWELWLPSKDTADSVIIDPDKKKAYLMVGGTLKLFFVQVMDYWDKKIIPPEKFKNFTNLTALFIQGNKSAKVLIKNQEPLSFEVQGQQVQEEPMNHLFQILFNLGPYDQADRVSTFSKTERQMLLNQEHLKIEMMEQELILWRKQQELIVVNLTQGFKAHFGMLDENFRGRFEDVLK